MEASDIDALTRRLRAQAESIFGVVFQTPEARCGSLGLDAVTWNIAGRAAALGEVRPAPASAVFPTFNPSVVKGVLRDVWQRISADALVDARLESSLRLLRHIDDGDQGDVKRAVELLQPIATMSRTYGNAMYAGVRSLAWPDSIVGRLWRCCELIREHRGDAHTLAWRAAGLDPVEINVLSELWREQPVGSVATYQMGWGPNAVDSALARLVDAGLAHPEGHATPKGKAVREEIELSTSLQQTELAEKLQPCADELFGLLTPLAERCADQGDEYWAPENA